MAVKETNGLAVAALVLGIASLVLLFACGLGALTGLIAVVLGAVGLSRSNASPTRAFRGQAIAGIVTGAIAVVLGIAVVALFVVVRGSDVNTDINTDPSDGVCDSSRFMQDPDC